VWNSQNFITGYINIPIFFGLWTGWYLYMRTPFWRVEEMDFVTVRLMCRASSVCKRAPVVDCT